MNKTIRRASVFCLLLVLALLVRVTWVQAYQGQALADDKNNRRNLIGQYENPLGNIIVGGEAITGSAKTGGKDFAYKRTYTDGPLYAPITGYSSQAFGTSLLEGVYKNVLNGSDTRLKTMMDLLTNKRADPGDVLTTIDRDVQKAGFDALQGKQGAAVALDPATGQILGVVNNPSFDPGRITGANDEEAWKELSADKGKALENTALRKPQAPGSTFKLVTLAAAIENGLVTDIDTPTGVKAPYTIPGTRTDLRSEAPAEMCNNVSARVALRLSCNNVFAEFAHRLGQDKMRAMAEKLGFNTQIDTPVRTNPPSSYPSKKMSVDQVAQTGIGQFDVQATPLQMAMVTAAIENGGELASPHMVSEVTDANGNVLESFKDTKSQRVMKEKTASMLREAMKTVVAEGGGRPAQVGGAEVGGKTGTAQRGVNNSLAPLAWFTSYGKLGGKQIAVAVVIENSDTDRSEIGGGKLAAPIAQKMMAAWLKK
ncbi:penicillin-binding transpeptidase domain-containing protein [Streptomyces subrutilus]|uniref:Penicillin-binding protein n=1 Tax=Streptomyces subrutilus TaxID=36818 RepID=A0A5P2US32_9ACTN|nr:penicillin-binding transpeptidase domain-containing protein [Streptomyces subrutilus]QEU81159.1 penicillin-binding protein 2 [Streptomyces subrutilus]WSJ29523.1 penicillin-binding transpeptidase domain-containing protein [Streptomyces subrutilus]GGZ79586.1 penicillin-binding protein [Streptomyces subrutilus]